MAPSSVSRSYTYIYCYRRTVTYRHMAVEISAQTSLGSDGKHPLRIAHGIPVGYVGVHFHRTHPDRQSYIGAHPTRYGEGIVAIEHDVVKIDIAYGMAVNGIIPVVERTESHVFLQEGLLVGKALLSSVCPGSIRVRCDTKAAGWHWHNCAHRPIPGYIRH